MSRRLKKTGEYAKDQTVYVLYDGERPIDFIVIVEDEDDRPVFFSYKHNGAYFTKSYGDEESLKADLISGEAKFIKKEKQ